MPNAKENYTALIKDHLSPWLMSRGWTKDRGYRWEKFNDNHTVLAVITVSKYWNDTPEVVSISLNIMIHDPEIRRQRNEEAVRVRASGEASRDYFGEQVFLAHGEVVADDDLSELAKKFYQAITAMTEPYVLGSLPLQDEDKNAAPGLYPDLLCNGEPKVFTSWYKEN